MTLKILEASEANFNNMAGKDVVLQNGEGVLYIKVVLLKPETIKAGDIPGVVQNAPAVVMCGQLDKIQSQINEWLSQSIKEYSQHGD